MLKFVKKHGAVSYIEFKILEKRKISAYMLMFNAYECEVYYDFTRRKIELYHILRGKVGVVKKGKILHVDYIK